MRDEELCFTSKFSCVVDLRPLLRQKRVNVLAVGLETISADARREECEHILDGWRVAVVVDVGRFVELVFALSDLREYGFLGSEHASVDGSSEGLPAGVFVVLRLDRASKQLDACKTTAVSSVDPVFERRPGSMLSNFGSYSCVWIRSESHLDLFDEVTGEGDVVFDIVVVDFVYRCDELGG